MNNDIAKTEKTQRESDDQIIDLLTADVDHKADRVKLVLSVLKAAAIPLDPLTSEVLHELGCKMGALISNCCDE